MKAIVNKIRRFGAVVFNMRHYAERLNRSVDVENELLKCAAGKRGPLTKDECRELAYKLGIPDCYRKK